VALIAVGVWVILPVPAMLPVTLPVRLPVLVAGIDEVFMVFSVRITG
jgi:hypothetical protein